MNMHEAWPLMLGRQIDKLNDPFALMYREFVDLYQDLDIRRSFIHGRVLVAGGADGQIERAFLCDPDSAFRTPYKEIDSVWTTDSAHLLTASFRYSWPFYSGFQIGITAALQTKRAIISFGYAFQDLLESAPDSSFDLITFFGIPNFTDQLDEETIMLLHKGLKPHGVFMGSGGTLQSFQNKEHTRSLIIDTAYTHHFEILSAVQLPDWAGPSPAKNNTGLVLQKPS